MADDGKEHRTVGRVATILEFVSASTDGVRMRELVQELEAPRSSVHGLVNGLISCGYLETRTGLYFLGPAVGALLSSNQTISQIARPLMRDLSDEVGETVMLGVRTGDTLVYIEAAESRHLIRYSAPLHERRDLFPASSGKCMLAFGRKESAEDYIERRLPATRNAVQRELERVVTDGYAVNYGETIPDVASLAVPIFNGERVAATLAIAGPLARIDRSHLESLAAQARDVAARISSAL